MHIFLSPHFDDAVYSCGGTMHRLRREGERVHTITIMAGRPFYPHLQTPILRDLHTRWAAGDDPVGMRIAEDQAALKTLGASVTHLEIPDCIYRTSQDGDALYPTEDALWSTIHPDDDALSHLNSIASMISGMRGSNQAGSITHLYAPLAVGDHVDHIIVRDWALALARSNVHLRVSLYTDYPYMRDVERITHARATVPQPLTPRDVTLTPDDIQAKIDAMACYDSQISTFWADAEAMASDVRTIFAGSNGLYVERFWDTA